MLRTLVPAAVAVAALAAALAPPAALAAQPPQRTLEVRDAWSRPAAAGATGAGFMTLVNHGPKAETLVKVESPVARRAEMHRSSVSASGVMSMQPLQQVIVPAGGSVVFAPGGTHLMLIGLSKPLKPGDQAPAVLSFASGARLSVAFPVRTQGAAEPHAMEHMTH